MGNTPPSDDREPLNAEQYRDFNEGEHFIALARKEQALAAAAEIDLEKKQREHDSDAASNVRNWVLHFETPVRDTKSVREQLDQWHRLDADAPWTIIMNSPGGSVIDGMALFDHLVAHSIRGGGTHHITIVVRGMAASMGGIVLQAADKRVCGPEALVLIHKISSMVGGSLDELEDEVRLLKMMNERVERIFINRSAGNLKLATLRRNWSRRDWWLDSETALKLGVVDAVG